MSAKFVIPERELKMLDAKLAKLSMFHQSDVLLAGMRAAGRAVRDRSQELAPAMKDEFESAYASGMLSNKTISAARKLRGVSLKTHPAWKVMAFVRDYEPVLEVRVKASRRAGHLHLVELGHEIHAPKVLFSAGGKLVTHKGATASKTGRRTKSVKFLSRGGKYSQPAQREAMNKAILQAVKKLIGG